MLLYTYRIFFIFHVIHFQHVGFVAETPNKKANLSEYYSSGFHNLYPLSGIAEKKYCRLPNRNVATTVGTKSPGIVDDFVSGCGNKKYKFLNAQKFYSAHWMECCKLGLIPASLETRQELNCVSENYIKKFGNGSQNKETFFFTSHVDQNLDRYFVSCITGNTLPQEVWYYKEPDNFNKLEACVALRMANKKFRLVDIACSINNMLCEMTDDISKWSIPKNCFDFVKVTQSTLLKETHQVKIETTTTKSANPEFCDYCGLTVANDKQATSTKTTGNDITTIVATILLNDTLTTKMAPNATNTYLIMSNITSAANNTMLSVLHQKNSSAASNLTTVKFSTGQQSTKTVTVTTSQKYITVSPIYTSSSVRNIDMNAVKKMQLKVGNSQSSVMQRTLSSVVIKTTQRLKASIKTIITKNPTFKPG